VNAASQFPHIDWKPRPVIKLDFSSVSVTKGAEILEQDILKRVSQLGMHGVVVISIVRLCSLPRGLLSRRSKSRMPRRFLIESTPL
jgi:hypothetical protein